MHRFFAFVFFFFYPFFGCCEWSTSLLPPWWSSIFFCTVLISIRYFNFLPLARHPLDFSAIRRVEDPSHLALVTEFNKALRLPNGIQPIIVDDDLLNEKCDKFKHWLVGKFLTDCPINFGIAKRSLIKALRCRAQIPTVDLGAKILLFSISEESWHEEGYGEWTVAI